jgi:hypothetical protein
MMSASDAYRDAARLRHRQAQRGRGGGFARQGSFVSLRRNGDEWHAQALEEHMAVA